MSVKNHSDLTSEITADITNNAAQLITGLILQAKLFDLADSSINILGDVVQGKLAYSSLYTISATGDLTHKSYVDGAISTAISAIDFSPYFKKDGSVAATGNFNLNSHSITGLTSLVGTGGSFLLVDSSSVSAYNVDTRAWLDSSGNRIAQANTKAAGFGIVTNASNFAAYLKSDNIGSDLTYQFPTSGGTLVVLSSLSASTPLSYNSSTGAFSIQIANTTQSGYLSSTDWNTFNNKQAALSGTGFVKISGTTISYDNSTYALDSAVVHLAGTETITGAKTLAGSITGTGAGTVTFHNLTTSITLAAADTTARAFVLSPTLVAAANNQNLTNAYFNATYTNGAFTGVNNYAANFATGNLKINSGMLVNDANNNTILAFPSSVSTAVNYLQISNAASGSNPSISALGTDSNLGVTFTLKGTGGILANASVDSTHVLGRLRISSVSAGNLYLHHSTNSSSTTYCLFSDATNTNLNSTGTVNVSISNSSVVAVTSSGVTLNQPGASIPTFAASSGSTNHSGLLVGNTINTSGTFAGTATGLRVSPRFQSITGSTNTTIVDFGSNTASSGGFGTHTSYFNIDNTGITNVLADFKLGTVGKGIYVKEGTNATMGTATLVAGTVTVSTTKVTANSRIFLTTQSLGTVTVPKEIAVTARTAGTSFTITSADATDTSVISWIIIEPS